MEKNSAKDSVLRTPELISQILDHLSLPICTLYDLADCKPADRCALQSSLLAAATCCRHFREPALDALWRTMDSFEPIYSMLPIVNHVGLPQMRDCTPDLWDRIGVYAARIRIFIICNRPLHQKKGIPIHTSVFSALIAYRHFLLPRLSVLLIPGRCPPGFLHTSLYFASPVLERIETGADTIVNTPEFESFVLTVSCRTGSLRHLSLKSRPGKLPSSVLKALLAPGLISVTVRNPEPLKETLIALSSLPKLKVLILEGAYDALLGHTPFRGFPVLRELNLQGDARGISH
ncbi:hypothetical protein BDN72DRAFT_963066, partial [Pluteus cervinus]